MRYKVSYRGNDGAIREIRIDATDRTECVRECNARKIQPVRITEDNSVHRNNSSSQLFSRWVSRCIFTAVSIATSIFICAICLNYFLTPKSLDEKENLSLSKRKVETHLKQKQILLKPNEVSNSRDVAVTQIIDVNTNRQEQYNTPLIPSNNVIVIENTATDPEHRSDYNSGVEQVMGWIFTTEPGDSPPPLPDLSNDDKKRIVEIILAKEEVNENDSAKSKEAKEMVSAAKKELMAYLKQGGDVDGFLTFYKNELDKAHNEREESKKMLRDIAKEGDDELTVQFLKEVNERLAVRGIKALELPKKVKRRIEASKEK